MLRWATLVALVSAALAGCGAASDAGQSANRLRVVAAENFWGSLAAQLGGNRVAVTNIIHSPGADPHDYEPTPADARALARARLAIVNGVGYDPWASKLVKANRVPGRLVLNVGDVVGLKKGANPHRWYSPTDVRRVIGAITIGYERLDPAHRSYYEARREALITGGLAAYNAFIQSIRTHYSGVAVGASESIFEPLAKDLGLRLITPAGFLKAISEGTEPTAADKATADHQIERGQIRLWVFNSQNTTPDVKRLNDAARSKGIPITTITETPAPPSASFQQWQTRQLRSLVAALELASR